MINNIFAGNARLLPGIFTERAELNRSYLLSLKSQCLLQNFYWEAGIIIPGLQVIDDPAKANIHWGWEAPVCQLRGHFLGHWLSAASVLIATNGDSELKAKLDFIIDELERCQKLNGGKWIGPFSEKYFKKLETGDYIWSPQYTMHKLIMGLIDSYSYAKNKKALTILNNLSDWYVKWTDRVLKSETPWAIYKGEQGGMIEVWCELYEITGKQKYMTLAERYGNPSIFTDMIEDRDTLTNSHQNASIPFIHGAARLYEITKDEKYLNVLKGFWKIGVKDHESYCTGGQGAGEFWTPPHQLGSFIGERNQEFCTVYNMVRTADFLFKFTGNKEYLDYIEKALYNGFLAQQNKETGMPTYFLPMKSGSKKKWGTSTRDFWCCHGTMVQSQTIYPQLCYYSDAENNKIFVGQYIPSSAEINLPSAKVSISQNVNMKYYNDAAFFDDSKSDENNRWQLKFTVNTVMPENFTIALRIPEWAESFQLSLNGEKIENPEIKNGFLELNRQWQKDEITLYLHAGLHISTLSDLPEKFAIMEGPIVLAGLSDNDYGLKFDKNLPLRQAQEHTYSTFPWQQSTYRTTGQSRETTFIPLYEVTNEAYTLYWTKL